METERQTDRGATVTIIGAGHIGQALASLCAAGR